jgi:phosphocarrier protein FPr
MVGIVVVAHSRELAEGVCAVARQMAGGDRPVTIAAAGGLEGGGLGTSFEAIQRAVDAADSGEGVLVLMDLGSAVMTTQMVLEMLPPERRARVRLTDAPLVEGAIAAAVAASLGDDLDQVQRAAEAALETPKIPIEEEAPSAPTTEDLLAPNGPSCSVDLVVPNPIGLHARPAALFVQAASQFASRITVQNVTQGRGPVDAKSMMQVASQGTARRGECIRVAARGEDADEAIAALRALVEAGFDEMEMGEEGALGSRPPTSQPVSRRVAPQSPPPPRLQGIGASEGYAVAPAFVYQRPDLYVEGRTVDDPQAEIERFRWALGVARHQLEQVQRRVAGTAGEQAGRIFGFHRTMLEDAELLRSVEERIAAERCNAEAAVSTVVSQWVNTFRNLDDTLMRARANDVRDIGSRLLAVFAGTVQPQLDQLPEPVVVVAEDLTPSEMALLDRAQVRGICTAFGGTTSHAVILARTWGIPMVVGLGERILAVRPGSTVALDGDTGAVEVNPSPEAVRTYRARQERLIQVQAEALARAAEPAITRDGRRVDVVANIGDVASAREAIKYGAEGVGVLRTEFMYLGRTTLPDEEEQYAAYLAIAQVLGQRPLIVRTLDVGGDKQLPSLNVGPEMNPFLGVRAIRLCLERPDIFQPQLRAILRAGVGHNVKVLFPMMATLGEVLQARAALDQARRDLATNDVPHAGSVEVGIMIEVPAAAINADVLAPEVDFFSIGSNDLTQYTLACERGNERLSYLYHSLDPAVLRLIRRVIQAAHGAGKWAGLCGELAGQRIAIPLLLGLGVDEFSMAPRAIPAAKQLIRLLSAEEAREIAEHALSLATASEVEEYLASVLERLE